MKKTSNLQKDEDEISCFYCLRQIWHWRRWSVILSGLAPQILTVKIWKLKLQHILKPVLSPHHLCQQLRDNEVWLKRKALKPTWRVLWAAGSHWTQSPSGKTLKFLSHLGCGGGRVGGLLLRIAVSSLTYDDAFGAGRCLHLMGGQVVFWDTVGLSHCCVVLIEASHTIHFIMDAAGDVLNVLHVRPKRIKTNTYTFRMVS